MFIQTEDTPNPQTLKFLPGKEVMNNNVMEITNNSEALASPLAKRIFYIEGIKSIFLGSDFITVTKESNAEWQVIKPLALAAIMDHYMSGEPILSSNSVNQTDEEIIYDELVDKQVIDQITELIETRVRPAVAQDGGDITFKGFKNGVVYLHMRGACAGCPSSTITLKNGIENMLKHYIPEIESVEAIN
ncbi:MAG: NifU family protein [Alphaproteobacteria bacterium TMED87]|nr:NifU family protein [Rhodospirillaceae bacterium]OUV08947.1 MAG: NifU family protein [Alphaproteobacteria bacterium TMED87]